MVSRHTFQSRLLRIRRGCLQVILLASSFLKMKRYEEIYKLQVSSVKNFHFSYFMQFFNRFPIERKYCNDYILLFTIWVCVQVHR